MNHPRRQALRVLTALVAGSLGGALLPAIAVHATLPTTTVFVSGLNNPRGLKFGNDGNLYVAEGGTGGGSTTSPTQCQQVLPPVGPYSGGFTSRISKIDKSGGRSTVAAGLPSSMTAPGVGGFVSGVADVAFMDGALYGIEAGAGCSHGLAGTANTIFRVKADGSTTQVANLSAFLMAHPVATPDLGDFEPDGTWYSMVAVGNKFYAVEPNHAEIDVVRPNGSISRLVDISATLGSITPTSLAYDDGQFYLGNLSVFGPGAPPAQVFKMDKKGRIALIKGGLTAVTGVVFHDDHVYALEAFTGFFAPAPFVAHTGKVVRLNSQGNWQDVAVGLSFPTAMTFGRDGKLYVSNYGFGFTAGAGQIVRIDVSESD